jgi:hypothetical protein
MPSNHDAPLVYDALGVARALGLTSERQFTTRRCRLEKKGFPRPLPMTPLRWARQAVEDWVATQQKGAPDTAPPETEVQKRNAVVVALENYGRVA